MTKRKQHSVRGMDEDQALRTILEGTASETGERFFTALVENVARALNTQGAWVTEYLKESGRLRSLAFWWGGEWIHDYEYPIAGTPCGSVIDGARLVHIPEKVVALYPGDNDLHKFGAVSYMGVPLMDLDGAILGHLGVMDTRPMPEEPRCLALFRIFAARAAAELQRLRAESQVREREEKLGRLVDSAMDAVLELDHNLILTRMNPAAEKVFGGLVVGQGFTQCLTDDSQKKLRSLIEGLDAHPHGTQYLWISGGLVARRTDGNEFPAEATLSRFEMHGEKFHTLILRNVRERLEAEQRVRSLTVETEYLREEIKELHNFDEIIGQSKPIQRVMHDVAQVAKTDVTVLILGETGTGKELVARAVHAASRRRDKPFIKVNCAAIPATLIESEFFGHEKGAFTGATARRDGRFTLANGGTIFLDEVGELPIDLQVKLLRVLQESEFESVGSSQTRKVNVRVLAATNRDLDQMVKDGKFREDLYYRLNVFPITVPPLRDRGDDIAILASSFAKRFVQRMGREIEPLSLECTQRLKAYSWPGNVRELENVIERAVITAQGSRLNLDRALPEPAKGVAAAPTGLPDEGVGQIRTVKELEKVERDNLIRALEASGWRVSGEKGAARLMGMNPSTLASRMKVLRIKRPRHT